MSIGILNLHTQIPGCLSLKEKRSRIKPLLARLHKEFNISVSETGLQDSWQETQITCAIVSNDANYNSQVLQSVIVFVNHNFRDLTILDDKIEFI